jgi:hypothetical protein
VICNNVLINENSTVKDCQIGESLSMPEGCKYSINIVKGGGGVHECFTFDVTT